MNNLNEYIINHAINESLYEIMTCDPINESSIINGIKKLWNWITRKNKKKKQDVDDKQNDSSDNYDVDDDIDMSSIKFVDYEYSKFQQLQLELTKSKNAVDKYKNVKNDIRIVCAKYQKNDEIAAILVYTTGDKSPIAKKYYQFNNYAHIFSLEIDQDFRENGLGRMIIKYVKDKLESYSNAQSKGFTIDFAEYKTKKLYKNIGFTEIFEDEDNNVKIAYVKYENIKTNN